MTREKAEPRDEDSTAAPEQITVDGSAAQSPLDGLDIAGDLGIDGDEIMLLVTMGC